MMILAMAGIFAVQAQGVFKQGKKTAPALLSTVSKTAIEPSDNQKWWGYVDTEAPINVVGVNGRETYICAIYVPGTNLAAVDKQIKAIRFAMYAPNAKNVKVWLANSLPDAINKKSTLEFVNVSEVEMGYNDVALSQGYNIGSEGIYVGYSFSIDKLETEYDMYPICVAGDDVPNSLLLRTSNSQQAWTALTGYGSLCLQVLLDGDFPYENAAFASDVAETFTAVGKTVDVKLPVTNLGNQLLTSFDYTIANEEAKHVDLDKALTYGQTGYVTITVNGDEKSGTQNKVIKITKVNDKKNEFTASSANGTLTLSTLSKIVPRGIAVEEFTGTGCGYCPRGLVGMEKLRQEFGDQFVGIGVHGYNSSDPMYLDFQRQYAAIFSGSAPACQMNRAYGGEIDPYYGTANDIRDDFRDQLAIYAKAGLEVTGQWNADSTAIDATATIEGLINGGDFTIEYMLIADGLTGEESSWRQSNYYNGQSSLPEDMQFLSSAGSYYYTVFNDVCIATSYVSGKNKATAPGKVNDGVVKTNTYTLTMPTKAALLKAIDKQQVAVVALLVNKDGTIANAAKYYLRPQEVEEETVPLDQTAKVGVAAADWTGATGLCATSFAPAVITADGRNAQLAESYLTTVANTGEVMSQTITGLENGNYVVTLAANAFYTDGRGFDSDVQEGATDVAYVFANDEKAYITAHIATATTQNGEYELAVTVEDGTLKLGMAKDKAGTNWHTIQIKSLTRLVPVPEAYALLQPEAEELLSLDMEASVKEALSAALAAEQNKDNYYVLAEAISAAKASVNAYTAAAEKLAAMKNLVDATNVYTQEAYDEYYGTPAAKFEAKTLTTAEANALQDPSLVTGWHAAITVDNFLLSAWDTNPDFNNAPYYINTWSVEGDTDGSNFRVPFFEYWTGDAESLGERTLTATLNGVEAGEYVVNAWVRVRAKNGYTAPAYGITMQANDGLPVDVAAGDQVGTSQFYLEQFTALGTVGADGVLTIKFNVAADNNISWLSFKNVKYAPLGGKFYLRNIASKKFWGAGNSWGTQASLVDEEQYVQLAKQPDGTYTMETMVSNGGTSYFFGSNGYMDSSATPLTLTNTGNGTYTIANTEGQLYGFDGESTVLGTNVAEGENAQWELLTDTDLKAEHKAIIASATLENPADVTFLIKDAGFGRNRRDAATVWTMEASNKNLGGGADGSHSNACAESYHSVFTLSQIIENAPKGVYKFTAQGFYRVDEGATDERPVFYVNDLTTEFPERTGTENNMTEAGVAFLSGLYTAEPIVIELTEAGPLTVGARLENNVALWCIWDNFQLTYYGADADINVVTGIDELSQNGLKGVNAIYNLRGQKVLRPTKGLYIINGKKILVK